MSTKHFFPDAVGLVERAERGAIALNPALRFYAPHKVIYDSSHPKDKVAVISGGGAGHEPGHAGVIGRGMLTAAISGEVFASPSAAQICSGFDLAASDAGVIVVVNNYTGDCLNFGLAAEKARAALAYSGNKTSGGVELVIIGDDVAVGRARGGLVGRRGLGGNIFSCKILGAGAEKGLSVAQLKKLGDATIANCITVGTSLDHCHVPGRPKDPKEWGALPEEACEIGMGIHNEPGFKRLDKTPAPEKLVDEMLSYLLNPNDKDRHYLDFAKDDDPVLFMNNLGGVSQLEMNALADVVIDRLATNYDLHPIRVYCNQYMTSLNAPGFGISLVNHKNVKKETGEDLLELLDAPTDAYAWTGVKTGWPSSKRDRKAQEDEAAALLEQRRKQPGSVSGVHEVKGAAGPANADPELVKKALKAACDAAIEAEPLLTAYDTQVGDGDCGETLMTAAQAVNKAAADGKIDFKTASGTVAGIAYTLEASMGGTSGAIYQLYLQGLARALVENGGSSAATPELWRKSSLLALNSLLTHTPARPGDRTLVDSLVPLCQSLADGKPLADAVAACEKAGEGTAKLTARLGRSTYVDLEGKQAPPDPGAMGIVAIAKGIQKALA